VIVNCAAASMTATARQAREQDQAILRSLCGLSGKKRLIHFSSVGVYGTCLDAGRNSFENPRPDWSYGREKLRLEQFLARQLRDTEHEAVILRMGHVYGAGQWVSRQVLEMARDPQRHLPFDGERPSNAVHVRNVAAALRTLVIDWARPGTHNLCDSPPSTWRQVFNWNTDAIDAAPVPAMDPDEAARWLASYRRITATSPAVQLAREAKAWVRGTPGAVLSACPSLKTLGARALESLPLERFQRRLQMTMRFQEASAGTSGRPPEPFLFSDEALGPRLSYAGGLTAEDARAVREWYIRYTNPDALMYWDSFDLWQQSVRCSPSGGCGGRASLVKGERQA
jgi:hypothetical protein